MTDNFDILDNDYGFVKPVRASRQIRTKESSFKSIKKAFTNFRIQMLNKILEKKKNDLVDGKYADGASLDDKLTKKTSLIAKIEEKIMILNREDVPKNYVDTRAIKLKKNMMKNLTWNSNSFNKKYYSIKNPEEANIFEENELDNDEKKNISENKEEQVNNILENVDKSIGKDISEIIASKKNENSEIQQSQVRDKIEVVPDENTRNNIKTLIDNEFDDAKKTQSSTDRKENTNDYETEIVSPEEVKNVVGDGFKIVEDDKAAKAITAEEVMNAVNSSGENVNADMDEIDIESAINKAIESSQEEDTNIKAAAESTINITPDTEDKKELDFDEISSMIQGKLAEFETNTSNQTELDRATIDDTIEKAIENIGKEKPVSANESHKAKIDTYKAMTDDEILKARENIEYDKYAEKYKKEHESKIPSLNIPSIKFEDIFKPSSELNSSNNEKTTPSDEKIRDEIIIVPDRVENVEKTNSVIADKSEEESQIKNDDSVEEFTFSPSEKTENSIDSNDLTFDLSEATPKDMDNLVDNTDSMSELSVLRARVLELKKQKEKKSQEEEKSRREAEEAARIFAEAQKNTKEINDKYQESIEFLKDFADALEEDNRKTDERRKRNEENALHNKELAEEQRAKAKDTQKLIDEIDELVGPTATNISTIKR